MPKRIALFILGLVLAAGIFLLYQFFSGASFMGRGKPPVRRAATMNAADPNTFESRDPEGRLEYLITAKEINQVKDAAGEPRLGQFELKKIVATFYDKSGRTLVIQGDECTVAVDPGTRAGGGTLLTGSGFSGGGSKSSTAVQFGQLKGHVRLTIGARPESEGPAAGNAAMLPGELRVYFDDTLDYDGNQNILSTKGKIYVRSEIAAFDAEGFQLNLNRDTRRIEYLLVEKGNKVIIKGVGPKALALAQPATKPSTQPGMPTTQGVLVDATTPGVQTRAAATTGPGKGFPPQTYKLSFGQDVKAAIGVGATASTLTSERLYLLFQAGKELANDAKPREQAGARVAAGTQGASTNQALTGKGDTGPGPMPEATGDDLVVTWTGPMEMRPAKIREAGAPAAKDNDLELADGKDVALEAVGTADRPVEIHDARFGARAGRLWYHGVEQRIVLEADEFKRVELIDPKGQRVICGDVNIDQKKKLAVLMGPGTMESRNSKSGAITTLAWNERMDLELEAVANAAHPERSSDMKVSRAVIHGVAIRAEKFDFSTDVLDVKLAYAASEPAMEHLLATGNVVVSSLRRDSKTLAPGAARDGLVAKQLEILTKPGTNGGPPLPTQLIATGDASAWRYQPKSGNKEMVTTARLVADIRTKAAGAKNDTGVAGMDMEFDPTHVLATDGARIDIISPAPAAGAKAKPPIVALAQTLEADPAAGTATLSADTGNADSMVHISMGEDTVDGRTVLLDRDKKSVEIPGSGKFLVMLPPDRKRKEPTPMQVAWVKGMHYDDDKKVALFTGNPAARILGDTAEQGQISCENVLKVQLKEKTAATQPGNKPSTQPGTGDIDVLTVSDIGLDYIEADGKVYAVGGMIGEDGKPQVVIRLNTERLRYRDENSTFEVPGPGTMVVDNAMPEKAGQKLSAAGQSAFKWEGSLVYDGARDTITFLKHVDYVLTPTKPFRLNATRPGASATTEPAATSREIKQARLKADRIVATLLKSKDKVKTAASPIGLGGGDIDTVLADGGAQLAMGDEFSLNGQSLQYSVPTKIAVAKGEGENPAVALQPGEKRLMAVEILWDMSEGHNRFVLTGPVGNIMGN